MNLFDSSFLCLDIGTSGVRGIAHRVRNGHIDKYEIYSVNNSDTVYALKAVVDELEQKIGRRFEYAYITGNFGDAYFYLRPYRTIWNTVRKITKSDVATHIAQIHAHAPENFFPLHIIPLQYTVQGSTNIQSPIGASDRQLTSIISSILYNRENLDNLHTTMRHAHILPERFLDPHFLLGTTARGDIPRVLCIDLGHEYTTASIWMARGPLWYTKIKHGGADITRNIAEKFNIDMPEADTIKRRVSSMIPRDTDRFMPADKNYTFTCDLVNDIVVAHIMEIISEIRAQGSTQLEKYKPTRIILTGGGAEIARIDEFLEHTFEISVQNLHTYGTVMALSEYVWSQEATHVRAYLNRQKKWKNIKKKIASIFIRNRKPQKQFIPIMPSTLCFDMHAPSTYSLFASGGISMIHVDIMDGLYVNKIAGDPDEVKYIREQTTAHLHVHLMTESPDVVAADVIAAGADTVIVSTNTSGSIRAIRQIRAAGKRAGVALNPDNKVSILPLSVLSELDEVMVMTVTPGAAGQEFNSDCVKKISELVQLRRIHNLKFKISVDGGINDKTAQICWVAGADFLVSGSYLSTSSDFPLAVQSLLKKHSN